MYIWPNKVKLRWNMNLKRFRNSGKIEVMIKNLPTK